MIAFPLALATLALATPAPAAIHLRFLPAGGPGQIASQTINFGQLTPVGFGGATLNAGNGVVIVSQSPSADFCIDGDNDLVPSAATGATNLGAAACHGDYGAALTLAAGPYTLAVTDPNGNPATITVDVIPHAATVKSHYLFHNNADSGGASGWQLGELLCAGSGAVGCPATAALHLGDTIYCRDGAGDSGPTPATNPLNLSAAVYTVLPPAGLYAAGSGLYAGGTRILITSEHPDAATDPNGNPVEGGACQIGGLQISSTKSGDVAIPIDFSSLWFYDNFAALNALPITQVSYRTLGFGANFLADRFEIGPGVGPVAEREARYDTGLAARLGTADRDHFVGLGNAIQETGTTTEVAAGGACAVTNSVAEQLITDFVDTGTNDAVNCTFTGNFAFNWNAGDKQRVAGDYFVIGGKTYTWTAGVVNVDGDIPLGAGVRQSLINAVCTIDAGAAPAGRPACVAGVNYPAAEIADTHVQASEPDPKDNGADVFLDVTQIASGTVTLAAGNATWGTTEATWHPKGSTGGAPALNAVGATASQDWGEAHTDTFQFFGTTAPTLYPGPDVERNISVRNAGNPNSNNTQFFFQEVTCCLVGTVVKNNVTLQIAGNQIDTDAENGPDYAANTTVADVESNGWDPADASYDSSLAPGWSTAISGAQVAVAKISTSSLYTGGGTWAKNVSNVFNVSLQAGSPTVSPNPNEVLSVVNGAYTPSSAFAVYHAIWPNLPSGYQTTLTSRAAALAALTPMAGMIFTATATANSNCLVTSGSPLAPGEVVNGPGVPSGDVVTGSCPGGYALSAAASATATSQNYATGLENPDGSYNGALFPACAGHTVGAWNDLTQFRRLPSQCVPAQ